MPMTIEQRIQNLKQARKFIKKAMTGIGIPQLESTLREADMNLHWALWNLGEVDELRPELKSQLEDSLPAPCCRDDVRAAE